MRVRGGWGVNLFLFVMVLVLGILAVTRPGKKEGQVKPPLLTVDLSAVRTLALDNGEHIEFERKDSVWTLTQPFPATVNQARVEQLLAIGSITPAAEYPLPDASLRGRYGLSEPFARLNLGGGELEFGGVAPLDHRRYVRVRDKLYLVDDNFSHQLASKATDFVDKKLIPEEATIRAMSMPGLKLSKSAEGAWASIPAMPAEQLQDLVMQWATARAIEVRRGAPKVLGEKIEFETSTGNLKFSILQKKPELILGREDLDLVFVMTGETSRALLNQPPPPSLQKPMPTQQGEEREGGAFSHDANGHYGPHVDE